MKLRSSRVPLREVNGIKTSKTHSKRTSKAAACKPSNDQRREEHTINEKRCLHDIKRKNSSSIADTVKVPRKKQKKGDNVVTVKSVKETKPSYHITTRSRKSINMNVSTKNRKCEDTLTVKENSQVLKPDDEPISVSSAVKKDTNANSKSNAAVNAKKYNLRRKVNKNLKERRSFTESSKDDLSDDDFKPQSFSHNSEIPAKSTTSKVSRREAERKSFLPSPSKLEKLRARKKVTKVSRKKELKSASYETACGISNGVTSEPSKELSHSDDSGSSSDWEDVPAIPELSTQVSKEPVEVLLNGPLKDLKSKLKRLFARYIKEVRIDVHKVSVLCVIAHGFRLVELIKSESLYAAIGLSLLQYRQKKKSVIKDLFDVICSGVKSIQFNFTRLPFEIACVLITLASVTRFCKNVRLLIGYNAPSLSSQSEFCSCPSLASAACLEHGYPCKFCTEKRMFYWGEVKEKKSWIPVDPYGMTFEDSESLLKRLSTKITYVFAFPLNENETFQDVTSQYFPSQWYALTRRSRIERYDAKWLYALLRHYSPAKDAFDDTKQFDILRGQPLPTKIDDFKNHPLYALERHLLKFQAIYPKDCQSIGEIRGEQVYPRDAVVTLRSAQTWLKFGKTVKDDEVPYKIVKGRLRRSEWLEGMTERPDLPLYGSWQTQKYQPPIAVDGKVPRNMYGNVDLFKKEMLPIGCVHLRHPFALRACKKLNVDWAPATVDFEVHGGWCHPVFDGIVVCKEFADSVIAAANELENQAQIKEELAQRNNAHKLWMKFIKGLRIHCRLTLRHVFNKDLVRADILESNLESKGPPVLTPHPSSKGCDTELESGSDSSEDVNLEKLVKVITNVVESASCGDSESELVDPNDSDERELSRSSYSITEIVDDLLKENNMSRCEDLKKMKSDEVLN